MTAPTKQDQGLQPEPNGSRMPVMRVVATLIRRQPVRYLGSAVAFGSLWVMPVLFGLITARFFDELARREATSDVFTVIVAVWAYALARIVLLLGAMWTHSNLIFRAGALLRRNMIEWIYTLPGARSVTETPGEVISRFREDVEHTEEALDFTVDFIGAVLVAVASFLVLLVIDPVIAVVVLLPMVFVVFVVSRAGTIIRRYRRQARDATEAITGFLGETLGSVQSVKVAGAEGRMLGHFEGLNEQRRRAMVRDRTFTAVLESVFWNTVNVGTGLILILVAGTLAVGGGVTIGEFALFVYLLGATTDAVWFVGLFLARVKQAGVSLERMVGMLPGSDWPDLVTGRDLGLTGEPLRFPVRGREDEAPLEELRVSGLSAVYDETGAGVHDVDLAIRRGEFVVVTGRIGSGKTTLLRAVLGLIPSTGTVRWNGEAIADLPRFMGPPRTAYTPQIPRLFSITLRENLLLGYPADGQLHAAVHTAALGPDLEEMPDGLDTLVGPRGVRLSGGQVQRSAAARMFVRDPDLLVFDDLSSALDVETEQVLWQRVFDHAGGPTALVVSHRKPALMRADRILVMEEGRIVAEGTVEELLEASDAFRRLWSGSGNGAG